MKPINLNQARKVKSRAEAKAKADAEASAKREAAENELRLKREAEREALAAKRNVGAEDEEVPKTAAAVQLSANDKILERLKWVHRRVKLY